MSRVLLGSFETETDAVRAAEAAQREGWSLLDIYAPYPMHGTARLLGMRRSRMPVPCFLFGLVGVAFAFWFQYRTSAQDWPMNVGGRPWNSLPAFVPVAFEMMVLLGGLGMVLTWLVACRLFPGKEVDKFLPPVSDNRFVLEVQSSGPGTETESIRRLFRENNAIEVTERV